MTVARCEWRNRTMTTQKIQNNGKVQMWQKDIMLSVITESEANELVESGTYKRINSQAIDLIPSGA